MERTIDRLFDAATKLFPILQGREITAEYEDDRNSLSITSPHITLSNLHLALQQAYPEAGMPYYRNRCWALSCWQPIYLSLICVYLIKQVPNSLSGLQQERQGTFIGGFAIEDGKWISGEKEVCILAATEQLKPLLISLQTAHEKEFGGSAPLYKALLADQLMESLVLAQGLFSATIKQIQDDYQLWAKLLDLPTNPLKRLQYDNERVSYTRYTCCLHFNREKGVKCANCPRQAKLCKTKVCKQA